MSKTKNRYLQAVATIVLILALIRCVFPRIAAPEGQDTSLPSDLAVQDSVQVEDTTYRDDAEATLMKQGAITADVQNEHKGLSSSAMIKWDDAPHRILSVPDYKTAFPDSNNVQLMAAGRWGVSPVKNREDALERMSELVYIGCSPYYHVDPLHRSIPYMVPHAAVLLQDIGVAFFDSLQMKGVPLHRFIVTSVLRTEEDVARLRRYNKNATERSCHLFGTTFDITYNRYETVQSPDGPKVRQVSNDTLKWVLSEVLRDMRQQGRCYIKYEIKQPCFHITVR